MKLFKKILPHLIVLAVLGLIYYIIFVIYFNFEILGFIYFVIIYALVALFYHYVNKKTKHLIKRKNKIILIISTAIVLFLLFGAMFGGTDYILAKNGKAPIFSLYKFNNHTEKLLVEDDENYSGYRYIADEYYGLGYKIVVCDFCQEQVYFMPFGMGTYAWFIGMPVDKLSGQWFNANNNDIYMSIDGVGNYSLSTYGKITEEGTYILKDDDSVTLNPLNGNKTGNCTVRNNYHELHCDKYDDIFMK